MPDKTNLTIKLDKDVRDEFGELCSRIGISMAAVLNAYIRQSIRQQGISFSLRDGAGSSPVIADNTDVNIIASKFLTKHTKAFEELAK